MIFYVKIVHGFIYLIDIQVTSKYVFDNGKCKLHDMTK